MNATIRLPQGEKIKVTIPKGYQIKKAGKTQQGDLVFETEKKRFIPVDEVGDNVDDYFFVLTKKGGVISNNKTEIERMEKLLQDSEAKRKKLKEKLDILCNFNNSDIGLIGEDKEEYARIREEMINLHARENTYRIEIQKLKRELF